MNRALPLAAGVGLLAALGLYQLVPSLPTALGTGAVYAGAAYFYLAFDVSLLAATPRFEDRADRAGYALGLFGLSVTPVLFGHYADGDAAVFGFVIVFFGAVAFLTLSERARRLDDGTA
ncbi:hypothetical protein DVK05_03525 [Halorubrum sp. Atlit-8R]|uniref:hypothetical protein n=1 Tax=unclassified Halorubrum TaxID=2642239 RepID=UPI000EF24182|nr:MULTISPECIES: hypothetical protein [unclassified Halorubrum]RLM70975.1 hypothetical protein DVK08_02235 [Halorubrum sp. Atlit-9R]RLM71843.1 hypothetical protein DVK08_06980 [Halorubrum sp. Atlit-9R]RLM82872.1 hypothetical protein DVK05_03525 [Halorubrum sp. Atlit-8R]